MTQLTNAQRDELVEQYVELLVDRMDTESLVQIATETLTDFYDNLSLDELKIEIEGTHSEEEYDELVDNVTNQTLEVN